MRQREREREREREGGPRARNAARIHREMENANGAAVKGGRPGCVGY